MPFGTTGFWDCFDKFSPFTNLRPPLSGRPQCFYSDRYRFRGYVAAKLAQLEGGTAGMLTSSGQAANFYAIFNIAGCGDHVVASSTIYGGTYNLFHVTMRKMGVEFTFVSPDCSEEELGRSQPGLTTSSTPWPGRAESTWSRSGSNWRES